MQNEGSFISEKSKPQQGYEFPFRLPVTPSHTYSLREEGFLPHLILMTHDHPLTQEPANSVPTLSCIAAARGQFCYKPSVRFSGSSPEPKMPSSGNRLKSQLGTKKCKWAEDAGPQAWAGRRRPGKPRWAPHDTCAGIETAGATLRWKLRFPQRSEHTEGNWNKSLSPRPSCVTVKLLLE